mgnify:CR=1 FL=1
MVLLLLLMMMMIIVARSTTSGLLPHGLALLVFLLEVLDAPLELPIVLHQAVDVRQDHVLDLWKLFSSGHTLDALL